LKFEGREVAPDLDESLHPLSKLACLPQHVQNFFGSEFQSFQR
jgi:hypothetical protein